MSCARLAQVREEYALPENSEIRREADTIMKWYAVWHYALGRYGMLAMDLANHGIERLKDSACVTLALYIYLKLISAQVVPRARVRAPQACRAVPLAHGAHTPHALQSHRSHAPNAPQLQDGRIMPRTELATRLPASQMAELAQDPETARPRVMLLVVLASGGHLIPYKVGFPLEFVRECQADRALSRAAAEMWLPVLQGMIAQGLVPP